MRDEEEFTASEDGEDYRSPLNGISDSPLQISAEPLAQGSVGSQSPVEAHSKRHVVVCGVLRCRGVMVLLMPSVLIWRVPAGPRWRWGGGGEPGGPR